MQHAHLIVCTTPGCAGHRDDLSVLLCGVAYLVRAMVRTEQKLTRIARTIVTEGEKIMSEVSDKATEIEESVSALGEDLSRLITDSVRGKLSSEERDQFDAIIERLKGFKVQIDEADPPPTPPAG